VLLFLGPRAAALGVSLTWAILALACLWWGRRLVGAHPLRGAGGPFPFALAAVAISPFGLAAGWWLLRSDEWPAVGLLCTCYSLVGALVYVGVDVAMLIGAL